MHRIESIEDQMNGVVTYELSNGQRLRISRRAVDEVGPAKILRDMGLGHLVPTERLPVMWVGRKVGSMAPDFDPGRIKSRTFLYDARPGDFTRDGDTWVASKMLGPGDLEAVPGFRWEGDGINSKPQQ